MKNQKELFSYEGKPSLGEAIPLSLQHVVAMIAGCIAPAIILSGVAGLSQQDSTLLIQMALVGAGLTTLLMLYPIFGIGGRVPVIYGASFSFVPALIAIYTQYNGVPGANPMAIIFGAQLAGALVALFFALIIDKILPFFPTIVTGTVVLVIGLSLYPIAINYMGGAGSVKAPGWGAGINWAVGVFTLIVSLGLGRFGKGIFKLANVLFALIAGYILAFVLGMVNLEPISQAGLISGIKPLHFGIEFNLSAILTMAIIYIYSNNCTNNWEHIIDNSCRFW